MCAGDNSEMRESEKTRDTPAVTVRRPVVAAFDVDKTLIRRDSFMPFLLFVAGPWRFIRTLVPLTPALMAYLLGRRGAHETKARVVARFFTGADPAPLREAAARFAAGPMWRLVRPEALARLRWHQAQGHRCVLVSASPELYLRPFARRLGIADVLSTRFVERPDGRFSGELLGANCRDAEKVRRLEALLGPRDGYELHAYGDSRGDREMLAFADHPHFRSFPPPPDGAP